MNFVSVQIQILCLYHTSVYLSVFKRVGKDWVLMKEGMNWKGRIAVSMGSALIHQINQDIWRATLFLFHYFLLYSWFSLLQAFRLCRYMPGGHFAPHFDGYFARSTQERSLQTFMLYLNGDFQGGSTNFVNEKQTLFMVCNIFYNVYIYIYMFWCTDNA